MNMPAPTPHFPQVQVTPPKKRRRWPWVLLGIGGTFAVLIGGCTALFAGAASQIDDAVEEANEEVAEGGISNGIGSQDATADVGTPTMEAPDAIGVSYIKIPVTNNSSGRSDYHIELVIESADGATQLDTAFAFVTELEAGQSATAEAMVTDADSFPADAVIRVTTVERTASL